MKSSTIRRSTLSRESMEVIEALAKDNEINGTIGEYVRPEEIEKPAKKNNEIVNRAQEIDLLWQNFKTTQLGSNLPVTYVIIGFICGVITTLIVMFGLVAYSTKTNKPLKFLQQKPVIEQTLDEQAQELEQTTKVDQAKEQEQVTEQEKNTKAEQENNSDIKQKNEEKTVVDTSKMKKYKVKSGDTGESIIKHFYGSYSPEKAQKIIEANNLKNLDRINIDQELLIPVE